MDRPDATRTALLSNFIPTIRAAFERLPAELQANPRYSALIPVPSQILAVTVATPLMTKLLVLHLTKVADSTVWAYGSLQPHELVELLERTRQDPILQEEVPSASQVRAIPPAPPTVGAILERSMLEFLELVKTRLLDSPTAGGHAAGDYGPVFQEVTLYGDYVGLSPEGLLQSWIDADTEWVRMFRPQARNRRYTPEEIDAEIRTREQSLDWLGTFCFPPIRVGPPPNQTLRERLSPGPYRFDLGPVVLVEPFASVRFLATHYGYFAVESRDETEASRLLNLVCGALYLSGTPSFVVRPRELGRFRIDLSTNTFLNTAVPGTERSVGNKDNALNKFEPPAAITVAQVTQALRVAERLDRDARLPSYIPLLLDSFGRLRSKEWDYAFYSAWMIIETEVTLEWEAVIQSGLVSQANYAAARRSQIADVSVRNLPGDMGTVEEKVAWMLTALKLLGRIAPTEYAECDRLRSRRNKILHPNTPATDVDATDCHAAAEKIVRSRIAALT